ncbi:MAG: IS110 family transposase [Ignavibacteriaceae bacterium]|nr:IS110 family transposase [Ignavibacterium sp.]MCC6255585.1 IS110 family transposase [Ignavibacteriaceae bacterium]HRQ55709.1 IS110 family transposase [Ignavibacteriaceae bacterium]
MSEYFLGIDVSKGYADFIVLDNNKNIIEKNFQLDDTFEGHQQLYGFLSSFISNKPNASIISAVESTGGYENNWVNLLTKLQKDIPVRVARLNPFGVSHSSKADLKRVITDKISALTIAEYLINHRSKICFVEEDYFAALRKQWIFIKLLVKQKVQLYNQLESLVYSLNPELLIFCRHGKSKWVLQLLKKYPSAALLAKASVSSLTKIPYISAQKALVLINNAKSSVASVSDKISCSLLKAIVEQIISLDKTITKQVKLLENICCLPEVELLKSFNGIGTYSAVGLMLEIRAIQRFPSAKKLASFFGLHPVYKISGDGIGGIHMSKKGRKEPRLILFNIARTAINSNPLLKEIYIKHRKNGMTGLAAIGVVMHKILRIVYGMLKHNTKFNPDIDRLNSSKTIKPVVKQLVLKHRRFQSFDSSAPVSRKQNKKREEQIKPHNG